jgi:hypothetical protein
MSVALILQRRNQMLVHSYLYYVLDTSIVSDDTWQRWADDLVALQRQHPGPVGFFDAAFADWDGSTGMHLPQNEWVVERSLLVQRLYDNPGLRNASPSPPARPAVPEQASLF